MVRCAAERGLRMGIRGELARGLEHHREPPIVGAHACDRAMCDHAQGQVQREREQPE